MEEVALSLGACKGSLGKGQPVRFPGGYRSDRQAEQRILYFNPEKLCQLTGHVTLEKRLATLRLKR